MVNIFYLYRITNYKNKISGFRPLFYLLVGYFVSGVFSPLNQFINLLTISGILALGDILNDYYDWKLLGESNYLSDLVPSTRCVIFFTILPAIFTIIFMLILHKSILLLLIIFLFVVIYSVPPLRLKERAFFSIFTPPAVASLLFLEAYFMGKTININIVLLSILVFLFHIHIEFIHILEDLMLPKEVNKISSFGKAKRLMRIFIIIDILLSLIFLKWNCFFLITTVFSFFRLIYLRDITSKNIKRIRRNPFLPHWGLYELFFYSVIGSMGLI